MALSGSVEFTIKAKNLTSKPTLEIVSDLQKLDDAQLGIIDSAGRVTRSTAELVAEQEALLQVSGELEKRLGKIDAYEKNEGKIKELSIALADAKNKYSEFSTVLFNAQESGSQTAISTATSNLKAANTAITQTQSQLDRLVRSQEKLRTQSLARGGVDLTQGGTARATTEAARDTVERQKQFNIQLQLYAAEQAQEVAANRQAEAEKQAVAKQTAAEQVRLDEIALANRRAYESELGRLFDQQDAEKAEARKNEEKEKAALKEKIALQKQATEQLERFREAGARANVALDIAQHTRVAPTAPAASTSAATAVTGAIDPLKAQLSTLAGVESALTDVEAKIKEVGTTSGSAATKVETLTAQEKRLDQVSKTLGSQAGFIDKLNTQNTAVATARDRLTEAEAEVRKWAKAVESAAQPNEAMLAFLQQAQGRLQGATTSFNTQNATLQRLRTEAQAAGINVDKLSQEETRLVSTAQRAAAAQRQVGEALDQSGKKGTGLLDFFKKYNAGGRTTLSFTQRLRGEILSLAASYIGLQAAVRGVGAVLNAVNVSQAVKAQISQTSDSPEQAKEQFDFLLSEARRTSQSFEAVADGYRIMVRQAREFGLSQAAVNRMFSDSLTVSRSYGQTQEQLRGTMLALGQIFDKGTIQAQEFKQQLSNAGLAGLFPVLQKVMKDQGINSILELRKAMELGTISAANMGLVFDAMARSGQVAFNENMKTWAAQVGRFQTELFVLENSFADSGFLDGVSKSLTRVSELLAQPETQENIKQLGVLLGQLIEAAAALATNVDVLKGAWTALEVFIGGKLVFSMLRLVGRLEALSLATTGLAATTPGLTTVLGVSSKVGLWGTVVGVGIALGVMLDKIPGVEAELDRLSNANFWDTFERRAKQFGGLVPVLTLLEKAAAIPGQALGEGLAQVVTAKSLFGDVEKREAATRAALEATTAELRKVNQERKSIMDKGADATAADLARLKELTAQAQRLVDKSNLIKPPKITFVAGGEGPKPSSPSSPADAKDQQAAEFKRLSAQTGLDTSTKATEKLEEENNQARLREQGKFLELYTAQYKEQIEAADRAVRNARLAIQVTDNKATQDTLAKALANQVALKKAIAEKAAADSNKISKKSGEKQESEQAQFAKKEISLHEQTNALKLDSDKKLAELTARVEDNSWEARKAVVDAQIAEINQKYQVAIDRNTRAIAQGQKVGSNTAQLEADNAALRSLQAQLDSRKKLAEAIALQKFNLDTAQRAEDEINEKLKLRSALLSAVDEQRKAGLITLDEAQARTRKINETTLGGTGGVDSMIDGLIASLDNLIAKQQQAGPAAAAYTQKLELLRAEMIALKAATDASAASVDPLTAKIGQLGATAISSSLSTLVTEAAKAGAGIEGIGKAWAHTRDAMRNALADMLQQLAIYMIQMQIAKALSNWGQSLGGGWGKAISAIGGALGSKAHTGAVVGAGGVGGATPAVINPLWFIGAPRFHTGGLPGLAPDEFPIIAQKGEEILSKNNPRNVLNGGNGGNTSQVGVPGGDVNVHMHADAGSFFSAGLNTKRGQKDFFLFFEANRSRISKLIK